jgi:UDP-N-acetylglucosamine--N-acetylmuramyl-(pentapeptide) pyrophosphoryl-undecaprenol N-acetylglucosamine transferase
MKVAVIGGHLSPALAVINALPKDAKVIFIGRKYNFEGDTGVSLEYQTISEKGIPFYPLSTGRLQRKFTTKTLSSLGKIPRGFINARKILISEKPDVVVGFGGYLSVPACLAAKSLGIPIIIHEQTLEAGLANKIIAKFAEKICISWTSSEAYFPQEKIILTGNPVRKEIAEDGGVVGTELKFGEGTKYIYITGGSAGSHAINQAVLECIDELLENVSVIHQTGDAKEYNDYEKLEAKKNSFSLEKKAKYRIVKFIRPEEVGQVVKNASIVVGRSGINTVTELLYLKKPALLIPIPFSQRQEQLKNAQMLTEAGLGEILMQSDLSGNTLLEKIRYMLSNLKTYTIKSDEYNQKDAAGKIVEVIYEAAKKKNNQEKK